MKTSWDSSFYSSKYNFVIFKYNIILSLTFARRAAGRGGSGVFVQQIAAQGEASPSPKTKKRPNACNL